jgi:hypothetical protein
MSSPTYYVAGGALARLQAEIDALPPLRKFEVAYRIEGKLTIRATDAATAQELAERKTLQHLAEQGDIDMDDAVEVPR